jgi:hypothetical protein
VAKAWHVVDIEHTTEALHTLELPRPLTLRALKRVVFTRPFHPVMG